VSATLRLVREGFGETAGFRRHGAVAWPRLVASPVEPALAISLRRE